MGLFGKDIKLTISKNKTEEVKNNPVYGVMDEAKLKRWAEHKRDTLIRDGCPRCNGKLIGDITLTYGKLIFTQTGKKLFMTVDVKVAERWFGQLGIKVNCKKCSNYMNEHLLLEDE